MKMYGIREKASGDIRLFDDFFEARKEIRDSATQELVERIVENDYKTFPDGRTYIIGTHSVWIPITWRSTI